MKSKKVKKLCSKIVSFITLFSFLLNGLAVDFARAGDYFESGIPGKSKLSPAGASQSILEHLSGHLPEAPGGKLHRADLQAEKKQDTKKTRWKRRKRGGRISFLGNKLKRSELVFLDVDTQIDFMRPKGHLPVPEALHITDNLARLTQYAMVNALTIISSMDSHTEDDPEFKQFPPHCVRGTPGWEKMPQTCAAGYTRQYIIEKNNIDLFTNPEASETFSPYKAVVVYGVATEYCVKMAILGLLRMGVKVYMVEDAIKAITDEAERETLRELESKGVVFVTTEEVLESGIMPPGVIPERKDTNLVANIDDLLKAQELFEKRKHKEIAQYEYAIPEPPYDGDYIVSCGQRAACEFLRDFKVTDDDITLLRFTGKFSEKFLKYLRRLKFDGQVRAVKEGTIVKAGQPIMQIRASRIQQQIIRTVIENTLGYNSLIATKSSRITHAAKGKPIAEYGLRRSQGEASMGASRAAYIGGDIATSNVNAGFIYGIPISGTMAHSFVMSYPTQVEGFRAFARVYKGKKPVLLLDTYDTIQGAYDALEIAKGLSKEGHDLFAVRLDSGDLGKLAGQVREIFDKAGYDGNTTRYGRKLPKILIFVSSDLDEEKIKELVEADAPIDGFGVGTSLITGGKQSVLRGEFSESAKGPGRVSMEKVNFSRLGDETPEELVRIRSFALDQMGENLEGFVRPPSPLPVKFDYKDEDFEVSQALLTDFYQLSMLQVYFEDGRIDEEATFDYFYRTPPPDMSYLISVGQEKVLEYLKNLKFTDKQIAFLRATGFFSEDFLEYLRNFRFTGEVFGVPEGSVVFPGEPILRIKAPLPQAQFVETFILNAMNFQSLIATEVSRTSVASSGIAFVEDGHAYSQGKAHRDVARASFIGSASATTNVSAAGDFGIPLRNASQKIEADPLEIERMSRQGILPDDFGITAHAGGGKASSLGGVYKLSSIDGKPMLKISGDVVKTTLPGEKISYHVVNREGKLVRVVIALEGESSPTKLNKGERLVQSQVLLYRNGKVIHPTKSLLEIQSRARAQLRKLSSRFTSLHRPGDELRRVDVEISSELAGLRERLIQELRPVLEEAKNPNLAFLSKEPENVQIKEIDHLVIGGGVAGLYCVEGICRKDKDASVVVISKGRHGESSATQYAQGGAAASLSEDDSPQSHALDTLMVGDGLSDPAAVRVLASEALLRIRELIEMGAEFDTDADGAIELGRESGSSVKRIFHAKGAQTGAEIERVLAKKVMKLARERRKNVQIDENVFIVELLVKKGRCVGALGINLDTGRYIIYRAKATTICTGGTSRLYKRNTNPEFSTGDGFALARRAGAGLANMGMIQFHPTALSVIDEKGQAFLISERVRGDGARLMNVRGDYFMESYHPKKEMAPRNIVARAVYWEMQKTQSDFVYLDISSIKDFRKKYPKLYQECNARGLDLDKQHLIPVAPAAHFTIGGVSTDLHGSTSLKGLFAIGEAAYTGVHGADRMASNSLVEGMVFGTRTAGAMVRYAKGVSALSLRGGDVRKKMHGIAIGEPANELTQIIDDELSRVMQENVCLIRNEKNLNDALQKVLALKEKFSGITKTSLKGLELQNKLENAESIIRCALKRKESVGAQYRSDYPKKDDKEWRKKIIITDEGLEFRDLQVNADDVTWLFSIPSIVLKGITGRPGKWFFGIDKQIARNPELYYKALRDEAVMLEITGGMKKGLGADEIRSLLVTSLENAGYALAGGPGSLEKGTYYIDEKTKGKNRVIVHIRLLQNRAVVAEKPEVYFPFHRFPLWILRLLERKLSQAIGEEEARFVLKNRGLGFTGVINDIPPRFRAALEPRWQHGSVVIYEGALHPAASLLKEVLPKYIDVPLEQVEEELRQTIIHYQQAEEWIKDSGVDFNVLKENLLKIYKEKRPADPGFTSLLKGIKRQYGYRSKSISVLLRELAVHIINEAILFHKLPQIIDDEGREVDLKPGVLEGIVNFIIDNRLLTEAENTSHNRAILKGLVKGMRIKEGVREKIVELFAGMGKVYSSPEQEKSFYSRVQAAMNKADALQQGKRLLFQQEDLFKTRDRRPLSGKSFSTLSTMYEFVNARYPGILHAVLGFADVGKIREFKKDPTFRGLNFANHPEAGAYILKHKRLFAELGLSPDDEELALMLVREHGFIGQSKRGEVTDEVFKPILQLVIDRKDLDVLKLYFMVNVIDTAVVWEGLFTEDFFQRFFGKYQELEGLVKKAIKEGKSAEEVLGEEAGAFLSDEEGVVDYVLERMHGIMPAYTRKEIQEAVDTVFDNMEGPEKKVKQDFFKLMSRQKQGFSLWYPEMAFSWIEPVELQIGFLYAALKVADMRCMRRGKPIDINFYEIAREVNRRDESRLNEGNRNHIKKALESLGVEVRNRCGKARTLEGFSSWFGRLYRKGFMGLRFALDNKKSALYCGFDPMAPLELSRDQAETRIAELEELIDRVREDNPLGFVRKVEMKKPKNVGVFAASFDPVQRTHRYMIEKAIKEYNLDEIILVAGKGHIAKEEFGATLAERLFILEQETKQMAKVSIAVSHSGRFVDMAEILGVSSPGTRFHFIMGSDNFEQMLDEGKSGNTKEDLDRFFISNRLLVAPRGYFTGRDINRVLIERGVEEYSRFIYPLTIPREYRFDSSTEARRIIRDNVPESRLISTNVMRIVKALGLYKRKAKEEIELIKEAPVKVVFVNLTSPRHRVISGPQGINALVGDLRRTFGDEVVVSAIDTQFGMTPGEVVEELKRRKPDVIGLSAQLESTDFLYELLDRISLERSFMERRVLTAVGHNLPTNENRGILAKYPFVVTVRGEGELAVRETVRYMRGELSLYDIPAASFVHHGKIIENDGLPVTVEDLGIPARDDLLKILRSGGDVWIETSRGCGWGRCAFCFKDPFRAHKWEPFPDDVVLEGLEYLYKMGAKHVSFTDPEFFGGGTETLRGLRRARRLAEGMIKRGIKLRIAFSARADSVYKETDSAKIRKEKIETLKLLRKAGFESAFIGAESGSERQLRESFRKGVTVKENEEAIRILRELGFRVCIGFIPLDPYTNLEDLRANIDFIRRNELFLEVSFPLNQLKVQMNTEYYRRTLADGLLGERRRTLHTYNCRYQDPDIQKIADSINRFAREIGSVFYVLKYMYRTKDLNQITGEEEERETLKQFFIDYNRLEVGFLDAMVRNVKNTKKFYRAITEFRKKRLSLVLNVEAKIKDGTIKDENRTLFDEIEKIRPLLKDFKAGRLPDVEGFSITSLAGEEKEPAARIREILKEGFPKDADTLKALVAYAGMVKERGELVKFDDLPASEVNRRLELYIKVSDDLETITLSKVLDDSEVYGKDGSVDYSKLRLQHIATFPSCHLVFPDNYVAKNFSGEILTRILILFMRGGKYTEYMDTITSHDSRVDIDTWSTNIDTVYLHKVLKESGILDRTDIKTVLEVGVGGGHIATACAKNLKGLEKLMVTDISIYALMAANRNLLPYTKKRGIVLENYLGKGIRKVPPEADLMIVNPPYIPTPPWEKGSETSIDDPYKGTGLIREVISEGLDHLNPDNPDACIIMNYSSLAEDDVREYLRAYGDLVEVETLSEGFEVPLKIERVDNRWLEWMKDKGLKVKERVPEDGFKYWHTLKVVRLKPRKVSLTYKDGGTRQVVLHNLRLSKEEAEKWNSLFAASKLRILTLPGIHVEDCMWMDDEWRRLSLVVKYYRDNMPRLKQAIEKQLSREIHLTEADLLRSLYALDKGFLSANIIRSIYFRGRNPHVLPGVIRTLRGFINRAYSGIKQVLIGLFEENFRFFSWDKAIAEYVRENYQYEGALTITDITDTSIGTGVYKLRVRLDEKSGSQEIELFVKRQHPGIVDLRNEIAYLQAEGLFLDTVSIDRVPYYYYNPEPGKPDLLIVPVIKKQSLDSRLSDALVSIGRFEARVSEAGVQQDIDFNPGIDESVKDELREAAGVVSDASATPYRRLKALEVICRNRGFIKRSRLFEEKVDFHCHTIASDGVEPPAWVVMKAWLNGMKAVAVTDHMNFGGISEAMRAAEILGGIEVIPGVELYTGDKELGIDKLHVTVYFPNIKTGSDFRAMVARMEKDPLYRTMIGVFENRKENIARIRIKFNELFKDQGLEITASDMGDLSQRMVTLIQMAGLLFNKYGAEKLGVATLEEAKEKYIDYARNRVFPAGSSKMNLFEIMVMASKYDGIVSLPHPLRGARNRRFRIARVKELLKKYATVEVEEKLRCGFQAIGLYGSGNSLDDNNCLRKMLKELSGEDAVYNSFPVLVLNESDYHGRNDRELLLGARDAGGDYSVSPGVATYDKLLDLRKRARLVSGIDDLTEEGWEPQEKQLSLEEEFIRNVVFTLAENAALGDVLGRNDRHLSNTRIFMNSMWGIESMTDFDISNMLDTDSEGENPMYLNYDWTKEDAKQGVSEITLLSLLEGYEPDESKTAYKDRLERRLSFFRRWKDRYIKKRDEVCKPGNVRKMERIIRDVYSRTPGVVSDKIAVLRYRISANPEKFLKEIFRAHLVDYEVRRLYQRYLSRIKEKAGEDILGYLGKYLIPGEEAFLSSRIESFRGILTGKFLKRRRIKGRKSIEGVYKEVENIVSDVFGKRGLADLKKEKERISREARFIIKSCFPADPASSTHRKSGNLPHINITETAPLKSL